MFSVFTDNHRKMTSDKIFFKSINTERPESSFFEKEMITQLISKISDLRPVEKSPIKTEFRRAVKEDKHQT